jgi:hypothetical protein
MKAGTITAKIRDAVWVRLMEGETERIRYRNIEMPLALKGLEIQDFGFDVPTDISGKITFKLYFAEGGLPEEFPAPRPRVTRAEKAAAKAANLRESENATPFAEGASQNTIPTPEGALQNVTHHGNGTHMDIAEGMSEIHTLPPDAEAVAGVGETDISSPETEIADGVSEIYTTAPEKPKVKRGRPLKTA